MLSLHLSVLHESNIVIFEGAINDSAVLAQCLRSAITIFSCVRAQREHTRSKHSPRHRQSHRFRPTITVLQEENPQGCRPPTAVMLSSAAFNPSFSRGVPAFFKYILDTGLVHSHVTNNLVLTSRSEHLSLLIRWLASGLGTMRWIAPKVALC